MRTTGEPLWLYMTGIEPALPVRDRRSTAELHVKPAIRFEDLNLAPPCPDERFGNPIDGVTARPAPQGSGSKPASVVGAYCVSVWAVPSG